MVHSKTAVVVAASAIMIVLAVRPIGPPDRLEANAIATIRTIQWAQSAYAPMNGGYYDTLECLAERSCVPGVKDHTPFLSPDLHALGERRSYRFEFHAGPRAESNERRSPSSITTFAVVATPVPIPDVQLRAFCGDAAGGVYVITHGAAPAVKSGRCVDTSNPLH